VATTAARRLPSGSASRLATSATQGLTANSARGLSTCSAHQLTASSALPGCARGRAGSARHTATTAGATGR
jgi:hypothetical protein